MRATRFRSIQLSLLSLLCLLCAGWAQADVLDEFNGSALDPSWQIRDGYALHYPGDVSNHASFQVANSKLSISFPGVYEHNQWWLDHAQVTRPFLGSGVYQIKVDSALTGSQQFGIVFEKEPGVFMQFMLYATDQVYAYVERFSIVGGTQYKSTVFGTSLSLPVPTDGPYYLRVTLQDDAAPQNRVWAFAFSRNGTTWTDLVSGVLETSNAWENAGALQRVGVFAGNQPPGFSAFTGQFDYFRFTSPASLPPDPPAGLAAQASSGQVTLSWNSVSGASNYKVYRRLTSGGSATLLGSPAATNFSDSNVVNGTSYTYTVTTVKNGLESAAAPDVVAVPHTPELTGLPSSGLVLALSAAELPYVLSNGQPVLSWANSVGPSNAATASGNTAPQLITSAINGQAAVRFDGSNDFLALSGNSLDNFTSGMSLYVVMRPTTLQSGFKLVSLGNGSGQQNIVLGRAGSSPGFQYFTDNASGNVEWFDTTDGLVSNTPMLVTVMQEAGSANSLSFAEVAKNGTPLYGKNVYVPPVAARNINYIGKSYWADGMFQGDIAAIILYNRKLSAAENNIVSSYIAQKYSIAVANTGEPPPPPPPPPLAAPANLSAAPSDTTVTLTWSSVTEATGYRLYRSSVPSGGFVQVAQQAGTGYIDNAVANGVTYRYVVSAYNAIEESVVSSEVSATPTAPPPPGSALPTEGLILALDAQSALTQYGNGNSVPSWFDSSPLSHHATGLGTSAPTVVANSIGGKPALRFDGVNDYLSLPTSGFETFTAGISFYVVMRPTVLQSGFKILALGNGPGQQNIVLGRAGSSSGLQYFTDSANAGVAWFDTSSGLTSNTASLISLVQAGGAANTLSSAQLATNGAAVGGNNVWVPPVTGRAVNYIGKSYWNEGLFQGDIAEVILYNRTLTGGEQTAVRSYIAQKYGISVQ